MNEEQPTVGRVVHVIHQMKCLMAFVIDVDSEGPLFEVHTPVTPSLVDVTVRREAYNSLHSARPTSGWHWPMEHNDEG